MEHHKRADMLRHLVLTAFICSAFAYGPSAAAAATINVPADYATIQEAITAASDGDTIIVADGTYTGTGNVNLDFVGKAITLKSTGGPDNCIIDCENIAGTRGFYFHSGEGADSVLDGFTIQNGYLAGIDGRPADYGAGICCYGGAPTIVNCIIRNNVTGYCGGGIYVQALPKITNCVIANNEAQYGGGLYFRESAAAGAVLTNCTIAYNKCASNGGGFRSYRTTTYVNNCIIWGNESPQITTPYSSAICYLSDIQGGWSGTGNINLDPQFVLAGTIGSGGYGDYHPQGTSPCIDTGGNSLVPVGITTDIDGNPRFMGASVDMGAYEINAYMPIVSVTTPASPSGSLVTIAYDLTDPQDDTCTVSFHYSVDGGTTWASATAVGPDTNPQTSVTTPATSLTFTWDADADLISQIVDVMVRVTADDGDGHTGEDTTSVFTVVDLQPPTNFTGVGVAATQIQWAWTDAVGPNGYLLEDLSPSPVAVIAPGEQPYLDTVSGENAPTTRLLRSCVVSLTTAPVEPVGTVTGATLPWSVNGYHAQFLYTAAELAGKAGTIKKIFWQRLNAGPLVTYDNVSVIVGYTTKTTSLDGTFASNFDVNGSMVVRDPAQYDAPGTVTSHEWLEIPLDRTFYFNGTDNLVVDINVSSGFDNVAWSKVDVMAVFPSLYGIPGATTGTPWERKFFINFDIEMVNSASDAATATAYTLVHDATSGDFTLDPGGGTQVLITVTEPPNAYAGLTGVKIERATNDTFTENATALQDFSDNYTYTDTQVVGDTTYWYRITFCNYERVASAESPGKSIAVLGPDTPPVVAITGPTSGSHPGQVQITYQIRDYDSDPAQIVAEYSVDSGTTWASCTMGSSGDGTTPLTTSFAGEMHTYVWDTETDSVGMSVPEPVQLRITPSDNDGTGTADITSFTVSNTPQEAPVVAITDPTTGTRSGNITITYTLTDENADTCDIVAEYSTDSGGTWDPCAIGPGGDGVTRLDSSVSGTTHTFVWASEFDFPNTSESVDVRIIADDGKAGSGGGTGSDTTALIVDNAVGITAHFSGSPASGAAPLTVHFTDLSVGSITSWSWDFGDGTTSIDQNPSHLYLGAGAYNVSLTVAGLSGSDTVTRTGYISVSGGGSSRGSSGGGCGCKVDRTPTPLNHLLGYLLPMTLLMCACIVLRRRTV